MKWIFSPLSPRTPDGIRIVDHRQDDGMIGFLEASGVYEPENRLDRPGEWRWTRRAFAIELVPGICCFSLEFLANNLCGCLEVEFPCGTIQRYGIDIGHNRIMVAVPEKSGGLVKFTVTPPVKIESDTRELGICLGKITNGSKGFAEYAGNKLIYLHIPKCAGTSIDDYFRKRFGADKAIRVHMLFSAVGDGAANFSERQFLPYDYISGHFNPAVPLKMGLLHRTFTILRHPVDRVISQYHYYRAQSGGYQQKICRDYSLDALMAAENESVAELVGLKNLATKILIGGATAYSLRQDNIHDEIILANAKSMLSSFLTVGFIDRLPSLLQRLDPGRDMNEDQLEQKNKGQYRHDQVPPELRRMIETVNDLDMLLYKWAWEKFS